MNNILDVFVNSLPIFLSILLGFLANRKKWLGENASSVVSALNFKIVCPFLVFNVLYGLKFTSQNVNIIFVTLLIFVLILISIFILGKLFKFNAKIIAPIAVCVSSFSVGSFAYPFIQLNFSNEVFQNVVLIDICLFMLIIVVGYLIMSFADKKEDLHYKNIFKKIFLNTIVIAIIITFIINYSGINVPEKVLTTSNFISRSFGFLAAFLLGLNLKIPKFKHSFIYAFIFITRFIFVMILAFLVLKIIPLSSLETKAVYLCLLTPISSMAVIYSIEKKMDATVVSQITVISILISIILYPFVIALLK